MLESPYLAKRAIKELECKLPEKDEYKFPACSEKRLIIRVKNKVQEDTSITSTMTAHTEQDLSSDESMPDLSLLNVAVPIPVKPSRFRGRLSGCSDSPSFLSQCTQANRENRFLSFVEHSGPYSRTRVSLDGSINFVGESPSPSMNFKLANLPEFESFSLFTSVKSEGQTTEKTPLLNNLIERFLQNLQIRKEEVEGLTSGEKLVLDCLIRRKLKIGLEDYVMSYQSIDYGILKVKRLEENYKMVFKSALKHLGNMFKKKRKGKKNKSDDIGFYEHYFGEISRRLHTPIEAFFHPNKKMRTNGSKKSFPNQKTMNSKYLDNLLNSEVFRADLDLFLDLNFLSNYTDRRKKKIDNLVEKLRKKFLNNSHNNIIELKDYLEKNSKCKLPWSNYELQLARTSVKQLLTQKSNITQRPIIIRSNN